MFPLVITVQKKKILTWIVQAVILILRNMTWFWQPSSQLNSNIYSLAVQKVQLQQQLRRWTGRPQALPSTLLHGTDAEQSNIPAFCHPCTWLMPDTHKSEQEPLCLVIFFWPFFLLLLIFWIMCFMKYCTSFLLIILLIWSAFPNSPISVQIFWNCRGQATLAWRLILTALWCSASQSCVMAQQVPAGQQKTEQPGQWVF